MISSQMRQKVLILLGITTTYIIHSFVVVYPYYNYYHRHQCIKINRITSSSKFNKHNLQQRYQSVNPNNEVDQQPSSSSDTKGIAAIILTLAISANIASFILEGGSSIGEKQQSNQLVVDYNDKILEKPSSIERSSTTAKPSTENIVTKPLATESSSSSEDKDLPFLDFSIGSPFRKSIPSATPVPDEPSISSSSEDEDKGFPFLDFSIGSPFRKSIPSATSSATLAEEPSSSEDEDNSENRGFPFLDFSIGSPSRKSIPSATPVPNEPSAIDTNDNKIKMTKEDGISSSTSSSSISSGGGDSKNISPNDNNMKMMTEDSTDKSSSSDKSISPNALSSTSKSNMVDDAITGEEAVVIVKDNVLKIEEHENAAAVVASKVSTFSDDTDVKKKDIPAPPVVESNSNSNDLRSMLNSVKGEIDSMKNEEQQKVEVVPPPVKQIEHMDSEAIKKAIGVPSKKDVPPPSVVESNSNSNDLRLMLNSVKGEIDSTKKEEQRKAEVVPPPVKQIEQVDSEAVRKAIDVPSKKDIPSPSVVESNSNGNDLRSMLNSVKGEIDSSIKNEEQQQVEVIPPVKQIEQVDSEAVKKAIDVPSTTAPTQTPALKNLLSKFESMKENIESSLNVELPSLSSDVDDIKSPSSSNIDDDESNLRSSLDAVRQEMESNIKAETTPSSTSSSSITSDSDSTHANVVSPPSTSASITKFDDTAKHQQTATVTTTMEVKPKETATLLPPPPSPTTVPSTTNTNIKQNDDTQNDATASYLDSVRRSTPTFSPSAATNIQKLDDSTRKSMTTTNNIKQNGDSTTENAATTSYLDAVRRTNPTFLPSTNNNVKPTVSPPATITNSKQNDDATTDSEKNTPTASYLDAIRQGTGKGITLSFSSANEASSSSSLSSSSRLFSFNDNKQQEGNNIIDNNDIRNLKLGKKRLQAAIDRENDERNSFVQNILRNK